MKFKAFLPALLALSILTQAMEPIGRQQEQQTAQLTETELKKQTSRISGDDRCIICQEDAKDIAIGTLKLTNCCQNFICQDCENGIRQNAQANAEQYATPEGQIQFIQQNGFAPRNQLSALCPSCRSDLVTRNAKLISTQKPIKIIDVEGKQFTLEGEEAEALLKCTAIETYTSHEGILDFSEQKMNTFLTEILLKVLAKVIAKPEKAISGFSLSEYSKLTYGSNDPNERLITMKTLQLAHHLRAPDNILFILSNKLWPEMQEGKNDSPEAKDHKKHMRLLARPHLCTPKHFLMYLRTLEVAATVVDRNNINFSFQNLKNFCSRPVNRDGWCKYNNTDWYIVYPFCSLDGIKELLTYLGANGGSPKDINLSGHMLETFSCDMVEWLSKLYLSGNQIKQLSGAQLKYNTRLPYHLILDNNPISKIDESFFQKIKLARNTRGFSSSLSFKNNLLTAKQKKKALQKFYEATHTLPERYVNQRTFERISTYGGGLAGAAASLYGCYKLANYAPNLMKYISKGTSAILGGALASLREMQRPPYNSALWLMWDVATGSAISYMATHKILEKIPGASKVIPMTLTGLAGVGTGAFGAQVIGDKVTKKLAKLTHPKLETDQWSGRFWEIEL